MSKRILNFRINIDANWLLEKTLIKIMLPSSLIALYLLLASAYVSCVDETLETVHKSRLTNAVDDVNGVGDIAVDEGGDSTLRQSSLQQNTAHNTNTDLINTAVPARYSHYWDFMHNCTSVGAHIISRRKCKKNLNAVLMIS